MDNQNRTGKKTFVSPTTPGLHVDFRNYIIELVCLNMRPKLGPRFWKDEKYWGPKYRREIKGVFNLGKELDFDDPITRTALTEIIKRYNIQAMVAKKTVAKIARATSRRRQEILDNREHIAKKQSPVIADTKEYSRHNAKLVDIGIKSKLAKLKELEGGKEAKEDRTN